MSLFVGLGGARRNACVAVRDDRRFVGVCEQERVTRVRGAGFNESGLPDQALAELLQRAGRDRRHISAIAAGEPVPELEGTSVVVIDHHLAHACAAFLPSPFESATVVICDDEPPYVTVWEGSGKELRRVEWPWCTPGFTGVYSGFAEALGLDPGGHEQRMEALARLDPRRVDDRPSELLSLSARGLTLVPDWRERIRSWVSGKGWKERAPIAAGLQSRLGELLMQFLSEVQQKQKSVRLCVGGNLFANSHFNSQLRLSGIFEDVFIPINPGNAGLAVGTALYVSSTRCAVTPFLGPAYTSEEIKATLDNCKLTYQWASDEDRLRIAVDALTMGRLVGWFDGAMEWGPRALGARSIVANPFSPYALENLNTFLKRREMWRGYALSGLEAAVRDECDGPTSSPFMECDYAPKDRDRFRHILPGPRADVRIQTVGSGAPARFRRLLEAFGESTGIAFVVNTSFNGFQEPIVCSPRDAIRVFYGSGLDTLILDEFVISK